MNDIETREDIEKLMRQFYQKLLNDNAINYIFIDIAKIDLEDHLPILVDFWEQNILNSGSYKNNVLQIHKDLNSKVKLSDNHFAIWLQHFNETVDAMYFGNNALKIKTRALSIATIIKIKLSQPLIH